MCELDMYGTIDVTVCVLDSINHLDSKEIYCVASAPYHFSATLRDFSYLILIR
ncbi:MAG: hypothetical protein ACLS48_08715 [[Eubacterium] siraeum]